MPARLLLSAGFVSLLTTLSAVETRSVPLKNVDNATARSVLRQAFGNRPGIDITSSGRT